MIPNIMFSTRFPNINTNLPFVLTEKSIYFFYINIGNIIILPYILYKYDNKYTILYFFTCIINIIFLIIYLSLYYRQHTTIYIIYNFIYFFGVLAVNSIFIIIKEVTPYIVNSYKNYIISKQQLQKIKYNRVYPSINV